MMSIRMAWIQLGAMVGFASCCRSMPKTSLKSEASGLAESVVVLNRIHSVSLENFPSVEAGAAGSLVELCESRVSHHHVSRLREVHGLIRSRPDPRSNNNGTVALEENESQGLQRGQHIGNSTSLTAEAAIRMTNLRDSQYVGDIKVGSNEDTLRVVFDTGSTNLWMASTMCTQGPCLKRNRYDPHQSATYHKGNYDLRVTFGTGELTGSQVIDDVKIGDKFKIEQQTFGAIETESGSIFEKLDFEGILGLAFPAMSANHVTPFFDQLMAKQPPLLKKNSFSFYFTKLPTDASAVFFGDVDPRLYKSWEYSKDGVDLVSLPVTEQYYWMVGLKELRIGDKIIDGPKKVVFDTGTTYYTAPKSLLPTVLAELPQSDCESIRKGTSKLPTMFWTLVGQDGKDVKLEINPSQYTVSSGSDTNCDPAWMPIEVPAPHGPAYIFGEVLLQHYFAEFHRKENPEVKIAPLNHDARELVQGIQRGASMSENQKKHQGNAVDLGTPASAVVPPPSSIEIASQVDIRGHSLLRGGDDPNI